MGKLHTTQLGSFKIGDREYPLARVILEEGGKKYDLGEVSMPYWNVFPHKRNRVITNFDADARKAWIEELAGE